MPLLLSIRTDECFFMQKSISIILEVWEIPFNIPQWKKLYDSHLETKIKFYTQFYSKNAPFAVNSDGWVFFQAQIYFYHFERFENFFSTYLSVKNSTIHIWTLKLNLILSFIPKMPHLLSIRTDECFSGTNLFLSFW